MELSRRQLPLALGCGLLAGIMSGLLGIGGGIILVPLLTGLFHLTQKQASATSLAAIVLTATAGALSYARFGEVLLVPSLLIVIGGLIGSSLGSELAHRMSERALKYVFALVMVVTAIRMLFPAGDATDHMVDLTVLTGAGYVLAGLAMGTLSALVGIGGGIVLVPILVVGFHVVAQIAQGTSLLVMIPVSLMGAWKGARKGNTNWRIGMLMGVGGVLGSPGGAWLASRLEPVWLQRVFAVFLLAMAIRMTRAARAAATQ